MLAVLVFLRFYVGCDRCQGWFHGACVGITQTEADQIDSYICPQCKNTADTVELKPLSDKDYDSLKRIVRSLQVSESVFYSRNLRQLLCLCVCCLNLAFLSFLSFVPFFFHFPLSFLFPSPFLPFSFPSFTFSSHPFPCLSLPSLHCILAPSPTFHFHPISYLSIPFLI